MKRLSRILCLCLACICMLGNMTAFAIDANQTGSISCLSYIDGKHVSDVPVRLWRIANYDFSNNLFQLLSEYDKYNIYFNPQDLDVTARFTKTLYDYIQRDNIRADKVSNSDSQGVSVFELLRPGVYLVSSDEFEHDGKLYSAQPVLVYLPNLSDNAELVFSAEIELKFTGRRIPDDNKPEHISRRVLKTWSGDDSDNRPDYIEVDLLRDGRVYDTVKLSDKNSWRYIWSDLDKNFNWSVVEHDVPDGYETQVDKKGVTFVIENIKNQDKSETPWEPPVSIPPESSTNPVTPVEPGLPGPPSTPVTPVTPPSVPVPSDPKIPQTGQLWWPVPVLTLFGLVVLLIGVFCRKHGLIANSLIVVGVLFILASLGLTMCNLYEDERVGANTPDLTGLVYFNANMQYDEAYIPDYQLVSDFEMPVVEYENHEFIGQLDIDVLGLSLPIISEFTYANLKVAPVRYTGNIYDGTCIIGAHNYNSHFGKLNSLNLGDAVRFTDIDGNVFEYVVSGLETLPGSDVAGLCAGDWDLTLFTCTRGGANRVVVRLECVSGLDYLELADPVSL